MSTFALLKSNCIINAAYDLAKYDVEKNAFNPTIFPVGVESVEDKAFYQKKYESYHAKLKANKIKH